MPRLKPPFPAQSGFWGKPTNINNVETFANIPWIIQHGGESFAAYGTDKSKGTKVFALAGKNQERRACRSTDGDDPERSNFCYWRRA